MSTQGEPEECLQITQKGYVDTEEDFSYFPEKEISSSKELQDLIMKAKIKKWRSLVIRLSEVMEIPSEIGELTELKELEISTRNFSINIPKEVGKLKNLENFCACVCGLKRLPDEFSELQNLKSLNLNNNNFDEFPEVILKFKSLEMLAINKNFNQLPDDICKLKNLKFLYLPNANIDHLPLNIGNLTKLEVLCVWGTKISKLPDSCANLTNIKSIYLTRSIFRYILPPEIMNQSPLEVISYILKYQADKEKKEVNESKMIIVGQGGVGKTCLLNRLIHKKYNEMVSTEGIDIAAWKFSLNEKEFKLNVWDFGGQEIYHATHQFFLTNRSLYVFVWDARQEEEYGRIDYWLYTIESFAYNSPIIIVVNKCDSRNSIKQLDFKNIKDKFPQIIDSFRVSCKENMGIDELRSVIEEETTKLPLMGMVWLSSWLKIRKNLEDLSEHKNIISYTDYLGICQKYDVLEGEALSLSKYLHDLGIIINFQNDLFLKDIVILSPEWGTKAVYKVLDAQDTILKDRNGMLLYEDLPLIWTERNEYPIDTYVIILRLMENFELLFEVKKNQEYLIAELLENEEIVIDIDNQKDQILNFQYNYEFLPAGILTRFIVRANAYLVEKDGKKACWKKGAYLRHGDAFGIIKLFDGITERKIEIKIFGKNKRNKKELLVIIRKCFDEIHESIPKISYKEYIRCNCHPACANLHEYRYLLRLEENNLQQERCKDSLELIRVTELLDGVEHKNQRKKRKEDILSMIEFNPKIEITNTNINTNSVNNEISIEIKNCINELQGEMNDLRNEVLYESSELSKDFDKIEKSFDKLNEAKSKEEVIRSGALNKIKRFLEEMQDPESDIGKVVGNIKAGIKIAQTIGEKYNNIAEWCGLPVVPKVFLGK